jgi:hypothetical protein
MDIKELQKIDEWFIDDIKIEKRAYFYNKLIEVNNGEYENITSADIYFIIIDGKNIKILKESEFFKFLKNIIKE